MTVAVPALAGCSRCSSPIEDGDLRQHGSEAHVVPGFQLVAGAFELDVNLVDALADQEEPAHEEDQVPNRYLEDLFGSLREAEQPEDAFERRQLEERLVETEDPRQ